jgi:MOSC domain-containing protein YiiM
MRVISVNVGLPREVEWNGKMIETGIFKFPVDGPVVVRELNLDGDKQADLKVHGGPNMAVYAYPVEHYEYWREQLPDRELPWGAFGENLSISGISEDMHVGDRFKIGTAEFMITQPRMPCFKLGIKFEDQAFIKQFLDSERLGFYFKVMTEGVIEAGDSVEMISGNESGVSISDIRKLYIRQGDKELLEQAVQVEALPDSWKDHFRKMLDNNN